MRQKGRHFILGLLPHTATVRLTQTLGVSAKDCGLSKGSRLEAWIAALGSALIGALATILAPVITERVKGRKRGADSIADICGVWICKQFGISDRLVIERHEGREVSGRRTYVGTDDVSRDYVFRGYFDGVVLVIAATSVDVSEARTLGILLKRQTSDTFSGNRIFNGDNSITTSENFLWKRQNSRTSRP